jgi:LysM repeat protein
MMRTAPGEAAARRPRWGAAALAVAAALALPGCLATTKHVEMIETDLTQRSAWTDERFQRIEQELEAVRSENEALRVRMDDLSDQIAGLGGQVSNRLAELEQSDEDVAEQARQAQASASTLEAQRRKDREEFMDRMNVVLEEVLRENERLASRVDALENSAFTFGRKHTVKPGESVASIASKYGVTPEAIIEANQLPNGNLIRVGQELLIPGM